MADTIEQIIADVQAVCPYADPNLARLWVRDAGRRTMEAFPWSWLYRRGQFVVPAPVTATSSSTTCTVTQDSNIVTFSAAVATAAMVGRQFRVSDTSPIYDIAEYLSTTSLRLSTDWAEATASAQDFSIFQSRLELPADCLELISVVSPADRWQLHLGVNQEVLDLNDPARVRSSSEPCVLSPLDYATLYAGNIEQPLLVSGSGDKPTAGGSYTGQDDAIFTIQVTTGGIGGVAVFKWRKNEGSWTTGVTSDATVGNTLQDGVTVLWAASSTFVLNDILLIRTNVKGSAGSVRMELYPYPSTLTVLPYLYTTRYPDLTDDDVTMPALLQGRGDILREKALEFAASWPGTENRPNPYSQINRRDYHAAMWKQMVAELARQDTAMFPRNVLFAQQFPLAPWPFGAGNPQEHDPWWMYPA